MIAPFRYTFARWLFSFALVMGLALVATATHAQTDASKSRSATPARSSDKRVLIEPYTGPPILLDEKRVVVAPNLVNRRVITDKYPDGKMRIEREVGRFSDDHFESDGFYREFHPNGKPFIEGQYRNGRQEGEWRYSFDNGQLNRQASFQAGQLNGEWENYRADGTLAAKRSYKNGLRHGEWLTYDETGKQLLIEQRYTEGKPDGVVKVWHANGKLRMQATDKLGVRHGPAAEWNAEGKQISEVNYVDGKLDGAAWYIRDDGGKMIQQYKNGLLVSERKE